MKQFITISFAALALLAMTVTPVLANGHHTKHHAKHHTKHHVSHHHHTKHHAVKHT